MDLEYQEWHVAMDFNDFPNGLFNPNIEGTILHELDPRCSMVAMAKMNLMTGAPAIQLFKMV